MQDRRRKGAERFTVFNLQIHHRLPFKSAQATGTQDNPIVIKSTVRNQHLRFTIVFTPLSLKKN